MEQQIRNLTVQVEGLREVNEFSWMKLESFMTLVLSILTDNSGGHKDSLTAILELTQVMKESMDHDRR